MHIFSFPPFGKRHQHIRHRNVASPISPSSDPSASVQIAAAFFPQDADLETAGAKCMRAWEGEKYNVERIWSKHLFTTPLHKITPYLPTKSSRPFLDMANLMLSYKIKFYLALTL